MIELERYGACTLDQNDCTTCGDSGVPVRIIARHGSTAICEDRAGNRAAIAIDFICGTIDAGDLLLVHGGVAIAKIEP